MEESQKENRSPSSARFNESQNYHEAKRTENMFFLAKKNLIYLTNNYPIKLKLSDEVQIFTNYDFQKKTLT